jgi:S-adenosylmethionine:tRNA ribosyltransferase-isomerase
MNNPFMKPIELFLGQWEAYEMDCEVNPCQSLDMLLLWMKRNSITHLESSTRIIILPGYNFKMTDGLITNFHQPKSTLLLLISAWIGEDWKKIYSYALENDFRFLSYGDSSLLLK